MHQEPLVSLSTRILQRSEPEVTSDRGELFRQWDDLKVHHKLEDEIGVSLSVVNQLED